MRGDNKKYNLPIISVISRVSLSVTANIIYESSHDEKLTATQ